jgi:hypothetical protein
MANPDTFTKDPDAVLDYQIDWSDWLPEGDTISTSVWSVGAGLTEDSDTNTTTTATVWVSGGTVGSSYQATNHIVTAQGREEDRTIVIKVSER